MASYLTLRNVVPIDFFPQPRNRVRYGQLSSGAESWLRHHSHVWHTVINNYQEPVVIGTYGRRGSPLRANQKRIIEVLRGHEGWVDARYLAETLGVTTRSVRNYVRRINEQGGKPIIESSYHGYRLAQDQPIPNASQAAGHDSYGARPQERRADAILRKLISLNSPVSIYDLCDEFFVSDSTIEADLRRVRESIRLFDLSLARSRDTVMLEGSEASKRKLISQLLTAESTGSLFALAGNGIVLEGYDKTSMMNIVSSCLEEHGLRSDDFGCNNVVLHLVIMIDRMRQGMEMPDDGSSEKVFGTSAWNASRDICDAMAKRYDIDIPESEVGYLSLVVASNSRSVDYSFASRTDLTSLIDQRDIELTQRAVSALEHAYYLEPFDSDFIMRVAVHVHSLLQRVEGNVGSHNPLLSKIKEQYPLVYDMAVFFARAITKETGTTLSEDEIAFLAFHIGAYLEMNGPGSELVTATFLYLDYHDLYQIALDRIRAEFKSSLSIVAAESIASYDGSQVPTDLVLSPVEVEVAPTSQLVVLSPILNDADLQAIHKAVTVQAARKRESRALALIKRFLTPDLFTHNLYRDDPTQMIEVLAADCLAKGYVNEGFNDEVLAREEMSPTSFGNRLALPHTMTASANRSFLSVVTNDQAMMWGPHEVNLIMLMGISTSDRKAFRTLFDSLIEVLSDTANVMRLSRCPTYDDFVSQLNEMVGR